MDFPGQVEIKQEVISIEDDEQETEEDDVLQFFEFDGSARQQNFTATAWEMSKANVKEEFMLDCLIIGDDPNRIPEQQQLKEELIIPDISCSDDNLVEDVPSTPSTSQRKSKGVKLSHHHRSKRFRRGQNKKCGDHVKKINYLTEKVLKLEIKYLKSRIKVLHDSVKRKDEEISRIRSAENRCSSCRSSTTAQQPQQPTLQQQPEQPGGGSAEKIKIIQQQISLLLHAIQCQKRDGDEMCTVMPHCRAAKFVLEHIKTCQIGRTCPVKHCFSSRQILGHFKSCDKRIDCTICMPFRLTNINVRFQSPGLSPVFNISTASPVPSVGHSSHSQLPPQNQIFSVDPESPSYIHPSSFSDSNSGSSFSSRSHTSQLQQHLLAGIAEGGYNALPDNQNRAGDNLGISISPQVPTSVIATNTTKEWQQFINPNVRRQVVQRFVKAIFPAPPGLETSLDRRVCNLVEYCKKVEGRMYEAANSRIEYLSFMAEEICKTQQEIERKRQQRKIQQQLQQQVG